MKKIFNVVFTGFVSVALSSGFIACGGNVEYVDSQNSREYTSTGIDAHDIEAAVSSTLESLLSSDYVQNLSGKKKVLAISDVVNDTMQQVDVQDLTAKITRAMRKSGKFSVTAAAAATGSGGMSDKMIDRARELRNNDEFNQYTTQEKGTILAPDFSLDGKIVQKNTTVNKKQRIDYTFLLRIINLKTGEIEWDESTYITKVGSGKRVSW